MLTRAFPFAFAALVAWWGIASTNPPPPTAAELAAIATPTPVVLAATPVVRGGQQIDEGIVDTRNDARARLVAVRDNRGMPWFARNGTALWTTTLQGLALVGLDGQVIDRIPGATDIRETADGSVRAYRVGDDWRVVTPTGTRRLVGPLSFPSLSPDGRYIAFELLSGRTRAIYLVDTRTGDQIEAARGLGRCNCSTPDGYGFPEWASTGTVIAFRDPGAFNTPPEERETVSFLYDVAARRSERVPLTPGTPQGGSRFPRCGAASTLWNPDGAHRLDYVRACTIPRTDGSVLSPGGG